MFQWKVDALSFWVKEAVTQYKEPYYDHKTQGPIEGSEHDSLLPFVCQYPIDGK